MKTSQQWVETIPKKYKLVVYDPDGWDRTNYQYSFHEELISKEEFKKRLLESTVIADCSFKDYKW